MNTIPGWHRIVLLACCTIAACTGADAKPARQAKLADVLGSMSEIRLEENSDVVNVSPRVYVDGRGSFLVGDSKENQVRVYSASGALQRHFGRQGDGPGEFNFISGVARLPSGDVVVSDMGGMITVFDSLGAKVRHTLQLPILPMSNLLVLDDSHILVTGLLRTREGPRVHIVELPSGKVTRSFFAPPKPSPGLESTYKYTGGVSVAIHGDTAAAIFSLADTVYLLGLDGRPRGKLPLRSGFYRQLTKPTPLNVPPPVLDAWNDSFSMLSRIFWAPDGSFYVTYFDRVDHEPAWRWVHLARNGTGLFEVRDAPMLLGLAPDSSLIFMKPGSDLPNVWSRAKVR
jgi:hypothetical protein